MDALRCDICGGSLTMDISGEFAICDSCGMKYSKEHVKAKVQEIKGTVSIEGPVKVQSTDFEIRAGVLLKYHGEATDVVIPESVTQIGDRAFEGCSGLTSVVIPNSVTSIGRYAFRDCSSLTSVNIPDSVTSIGAGALLGCIKIKSAGPTSSGCDCEFGWTEMIPAQAFNGCSGLTNVTIPDSVRSIGQYAFQGCSSLRNVSFGNGVTEIEEHAFAGCSNLTNMTIPSSVRSIGDCAFVGCSSLMNVNIPNSVTHIGDSAFGNCSGLASVSIGNGVTKLGKCAFSGCSKLTDVDIGNSWMSIGDSAFSGCSNLTNVTVLGNDMEIEPNAFETIFAGTPYLLKYDEKNRSNGCYIATAVYGSYDCPQVWTLRRYRDNQLAKHLLGRAFIRCYYAISPHMVKWFGKTKWFQSFWRRRLDKLVCRLKNEGVDDTPYCDRKW